MDLNKLKKEAVEYVCKRNPLVTKEWFIDAFKKYDKGEKVKYLKDCEIAEYEAYLAGAEPREKRITELEATNKKISDECHKLVDSLEKKQNKNELLETQNIKLQAEVSKLTIKSAELEKENEKLKEKLKQI